MGYELRNVYWLMPTGGKIGTHSHHLVNTKQPALSLCQRRPPNGWDDISEKRANMRCQDCWNLIAPVGAR